MLLLALLAAGISSALSEQELEADQENSTVLLFILMLPFLKCVLQNCRLATGERFRGHEFRKYWVK